MGNEAKFVSWFVWRRNSRDSSDFLFLRVVLGIRFCSARLIRSNSAWKAVVRFDLWFYIVVLDLILRKAYLIFCRKYYEFDSICDTRNNVVFYHRFWTAIWPKVLIFVSIRFALRNCRRGIGNVSAAKPSFFGISGEWLIETKSEFMC